MATEIEREEFGMTDKGAVVVIRKEKAADVDATHPDTGAMVSTFEVRHGVRTVGVYNTRTQARQIARGLVGAPEPAARFA